MSRSSLLTPLHLIEAFLRMVWRGLSVGLLGLVLLGTGCKEPVQAPAGLTYGTNPAIYVTSAAIPSNVPSSNGGPVDSYSVSPALPAGLSLDAKSGVISGTPTGAAAETAYTVTATNAGGTATASLSITVYESVPLAITTPPANQSILVGQTATFTVAAAGTGVLNYQWMKGGINLPGAISASYTTPVAVLADSGSSFSVKVTDASSSITSTPATLTVTP